MKKKLFAILTASFILLGAFGVAGGTASASELPSVYKVEQPSKSELPSVYSELPSVY
ncbi:hypothetical protein [Rossellomorea sp. BNER]|jgi:hypothetical protein|uniref:hypothetical protein n=1 Tax=Rossellomorea sp. BNER TaxID=2962031 RepID=UPI003AF2417E|nr:hypothetical protein [Rossellomorea sp. BNER]